MSGRESSNCRERSDLGVGLLNLLIILPKMAVREFDRVEEFSGAGLALQQL